jgi:hypothetical protein
VFKHASAASAALSAVLNCVFLRLHVLNYALFPGLRQYVVLNYVDV